MVQLVTEERIYTAHDNAPLKTGLDVICFVFLAWQPVIKSSFEADILCDTESRAMAILDTGTGVTVGWLRWAFPPFQLLPLVQGSLCAVACLLAPSRPNYTRIHPASWFFCGKGETFDLLESRRATWQLCVCFHGFLLL